MTTRNRLLLLILSGATVALPFAVFGVSLLLLFMAPALLVAGLLGWRIVRLVEAVEPELERRLIARQYARLARRAARLVESEAPHG